jgi:hypothetical protein
MPHSAHATTMVQSESEPEFSATLQERFGGEINTSLASHSTSTRQLLSDARGGPSELDAVNPSVYTDGACAHS